MLLFLHTYVIHDEELAGALEDLLQCWKRLSAKPAKAKKKRRMSNEMEVVDNEEPEPMAVLVDILVSLLVKPSSQIRDLVTRIFRLFASQMTSVSCQALVDVVTGKRDSALFGLEEEEQEEEEEEEQEEEQEEEEEEEEDVQHENGLVDKNEKEGNLEDAPIQNQSEEEEELLDDEAMFRIDKQIAAVLKNMKETKTNERGSSASAPPLWAIAETICHHFF